VFYITLSYITLH